MSNTSIVYYTDNQLEPVLMKRCQDELIKAAEGKRIITVSQKPMDFGENICLGDIGRSHHSLFLQALTGAKAATTKYIALAEHDCMYTPEHFNFIPPTDDLFYYNIHHWLVQWGGEQSGMYSYYRRKVLSNLVCNRELFIEAIEEKLKMIKKGATIRKGQPGACEPGVCDNRKAFIIQKERLLYGVEKDVGKEPTQYRATAFSTVLPNLDIRHGGNFSGGRRAAKRCYAIPCWGSFHAIMNEVPEGSWYQEATIDGVTMPARRKNDTNEKRWEKFIKPLITFEEGLFVDLGCNAGFYCRKMSDLGFSSVGVEKDETFIKQGQYWQSKDPKNVRIIEKDINDFQIPLCHITLLANVHYWLTDEQNKKLVKQLSDKALNVIVVSRYEPKSEHLSDSRLEYLKTLFKDWELVKVIDDKKHFSVLFKNKKIEERYVDEVFEKQQFVLSRYFLPAYNNLIQKIINKKEFDPFKSKYYYYLRWRCFKPLDSLFKKHVDLIYDVIENGITKPLILQGDKLIDGDHRLVIAKQLNIEKLIFKIK